MPKGLDVFENGTLMEFYSPDLNLVTTIPELYAPPRLSPQLSRFGGFPFQCVGPMVDAKQKRLQSVVAKEEDLPWELIDESLAKGKHLVFVSLGTVASNHHRWNLPFGPLAAHNGIQNYTGGWEARCAASCA